MRADIYQDYEKIIKEITPLIKDGNDLVVFSSVYKDRYHIFTYFYGCIYELMTDGEKIIKVYRVEKSLYNKTHYRNPMQNKSRSVNQCFPKWKETYEMAKMEELL